MKMKLTKGACALLSSLLFVCVSASAQDKTKSSDTSQTTVAVTTPLGTASAAVTITASTAPLDLARAAFNAEGGEKFRNMKSLVVNGSLDLYGPNSSFALPGKFYVVTSGERSRREIRADPPAPPLIRLIYDGQNSYSNMPGITPPPVNKFGMYMLTKFDQSGYTVSALPDKKKQRAFRITDAEGNATDFYIEASTGRVVNFSFAYNGLTFGTERKKLTLVDGVLVPYNYTEALDTPRGTFFIEYKVKEAKVNQPLDADVFAIPTQ
jgi:hypothetical protein